jgi:hypothetical protein
MFLITTIGKVAGGLQVTDDIVTRLREGKSIFLFDIMYEAADEIERLRADRDRWAKWGEHVFLCPNKGINPCRDCVSPATADAMTRVDRGGRWYD